MYKYNNRVIYCPSHLQDHLSDLRNSCWFQDTVWSGQGQNRQSPGELWLGLLIYYTEQFDLQNNVIAIRCSRTLPKFEKLWISKGIAIEDPFDLNHNLGSALTRKSKCANKNLEELPFTTQQELAWQNLFTGIGTQALYNFVGESAIFQPQKISKDNLKTNNYSLCQLTLCLIFAQFSNGHPILGTPFHPSLSLTLIIYIWIKRLKIIWFELCVHIRGMFVK